PTIETDPQLPRLPDPRTEIEALTDNLTKPRQTELATIAEPAIATILQLTQEPLAQLATSHHPLAPRAQTIVETRIAHQARHNPDPEIVNRIGPRPQTDSAAWDQAVESAAIYRERWNPDGPAIPPQPGVGQSRQQESQFAKAEARLDAAEHKFLASLPTDELAERRADLIAQARQLSNTKSPEQDRIISDISTRVDAIDRALAPRINEALAQPADYLTNTLGPRPAANPGRWDRAARTIETYRHATLGTEPDQGPLPNNPAIGPKPSDPLQAEGWQAAAQRIQALHSQPLRIAD
ncbi:MAG: hypothetical protein KDB16_01620, partial [Acidimicrobiales bacterium]|nr:hypothetical protein [Acidimicrobiales bacterium]